MYSKFEGHTITKTAERIPDIEAEKRKLVLNEQEQLYPHMGMGVGHSS